MAAQPWCVYCGGTVRAETIDHVPPIAMFTRRQRPKGLEVSACDACNQGTKSADHLASFIGRIYPDANTPEEDREFAQVLLSIRNNFPGLLEKMQPTPELREKLAQRIGHTGMQVHPLSLDIPELQDAMFLFGAKMGFAMHYHVTSSILASDGVVAARWFTNVNAVAGEIPPRIFEIFNNPQTLRQGRKAVGDQFEYESKATPDRKYGMHWATFRKSFAVIAFSAADTNHLAEFGESDLVRVFRPGAFRPPAQEALA